jgi:broad specificity phosphatase PhoE
VAEGAITIQVSFLEGVLRRVVITGLKDEGEANAVWLEAQYHRQPGETLEQVAERVVSDTEREAREYHRAFVRHLRTVRDLFEWRDGEAVAVKAGCCRSTSS